MITPAQAQPNTLELYQFLPDFVKANDQDGGFQFLTWLDGIISMGSSEAVLNYEWAYSDGVISQLQLPYSESNNPIPAATGLQAINNIIRDTPYNPGYSILLDINRCPTYALPWLGQFVGVRFPQPQSDAVMRAAIQNENAFMRGTLGSIQSAANSQMIAPYTATISERTSFIDSNIGYDPYSILVTYPLAGVQALTWGQVFADYSSWAEVESAYATWGDMQGYTTNLEGAVLASVPAGIIVYFESV